MSALLRLQQNFQQYILQAHEAMHAEIMQTERVDTQTRLRIYASGTKVCYGPGATKQDGVAHRARSAGI